VKNPNKCAQAALAIYLAGLTITGLADLIASTGNKHEIRIDVTQNIRVFAARLLMGFLACSSANRIQR
jgi:hypothetical protein